MDQLIPTVRRSNWINIIQQRQDRPADITIKRWPAENGISEKSYYYWFQKNRQKSMKQESLPATISPPKVSVVEIPVKASLTTTPVSTVPTAMPQLL